MSEPSSATPEPLRRRRSRDRGAGTGGEDDSWAHLMGLGQGWAEDASPPAGIGPEPGWEAGTGEQVAATAPPLSRRAARRREADAETSQREGVAASPSGVSEPSPGGGVFDTGGFPLRPWWATPAAPASEGTFEAAGPGWSGGAAPSAAVPATFLRPEAAPVVRTEPPWAPPPAPPTPEPLPPRDAAGPPLTREQPQVNPWPGQVRPALPASGSTGDLRRAQAQRTSDVASGRLREGTGPDGASAVPMRADEIAPTRDAAPPAEVVLPAERVSVPAPSAGTARPAGHAPGPVLSAGLVLPAPELPGPVLPGVERLADAHRAHEAASPAGPGGPGGHGVAELPGEPRERATGSLYLPSSNGAADLRIVPPPPDAGEASAARPAGSRRRRLAATPTRFPALGPTGEPVEPGRQPASEPVAVPGAAFGVPGAPAPPRSASTASPTLPWLGRRRPLAGPRTPTGGLTVLPSISGPASAAPGSGGLSLPGVGADGEHPRPPRVPGTLPWNPASTGAAAARAGTDATGAAASHAAVTATEVSAVHAAPVRLAGGAAPSALDVAAGLGKAGRARPGQRSRHPAAHPAEATPSRGLMPAPSRAVTPETGDESDATRTLGPLTRHVPTVPPGADSAFDLTSARSAALAAGGTGTPDPAGTPTPGSGAPSRRGGGAAARPRRVAQSVEAVAPALAPAPAATGRAGRNLPAAIAVGLGLGAVVLASLLVRKEVFVVVVAAAIVTALWELSRALHAKLIAVSVVPLSVGALGMLVSAFVAGEDGLLVSFALTAFGVLLWRIIDGAQGAARDVAASVFVAGYVPFLAGFALLMLAMPDGAHRVVVFIAVTVANDVGGYASGVLLGRHPMAPSISPKKSWEGLAGSFALCMAVGAGSVHYLLHGSLRAGIAVGAAAAVTATIGDLSESLIKRDLGIKDMGNLLPGHGGIMDRLDSLLPTAPAVALLLLALVPVH